MFSCAQAVENSLMQFSLHFDRRKLFPAVFLEFFLEKLKEDCRKELSTGKTQGILQARVFYGKTAGKSFLLEILKETCRKKFSTGKTQGKLQARVCYWKSSRKTPALKEV